MCEDTM